ncbi:hypothetical protein HQ489_02140 [Candidatus Woesearchaeota archaeon]|nr:hypothetical protein [Candidatus Woesearchaeota archaeon]
MEEDDLRILDQVTQNCLRNQGYFKIYNSNDVPSCAVDKSNIPPNITFSCPYHNRTRIHLVDIGFATVGCDYEKE